jgi:hypothetical protein
VLVGTRLAQRLDIRIAKRRFQQGRDELTGGVERKTLVRGKQTGFGPSVARFDANDMANKGGAVGSGRLEETSSRSDCR